MKIGRNDQCPCGSGKKYKQCCLNKNSMSNEFTEIRKIVSQFDYKEELSDVLCNLLRYMRERSWIGACHASCAALYVALSELGYSPRLCAGEVKAPGFLFDHSWIELDGKIIDLAASMTLMGGGLPVSPPIILDINIATEAKYGLIYGTNNGRGLDAEANMVTTTSFCTYMDNFPREKNGLWGVVEIILDRKFAVKDMRNKYINTKWSHI